MHALPTRRQATDPEDETRRRYLVTARSGGDTAFIRSCRTEKEARFYQALAELLFEDWARHITQDHGEEPEPWTVETHVLQILE